MKNDRRTDYSRRDDILKLLSDEEVAQVSTAETATHLRVGDDYLDLENLDQGVLRADGILVPMGHILPKSAVHANTWSQILAVVGAGR